MKAHGSEMHSHPVCCPRAWETTGFIYQLKQNSRPRQKRGFLETEQVLESRWC